MISQSPAVVKNGLVLFYDMGNPKSFAGAPTTNQFSAPTPDSSNNVTFPVNGTGTFKRVTSGTFGGYSVKSSDIVYRYDLGTAGCHYHGSDVNITSGVTATWSCDYYISPDVTGYPTTNYLANFEGVVSGGAADPSTATIGVWKRFVFSSTAGSTGLCRMLLYPGACGSSYLAATGYILYKNPQVEFNSFATPFVAGSRSNTQSLLDLSGTNTLTCNSLIYNSDGSFSFDGSGSNYITPSAITDSMLNSSSWTISTWVKCTSINRGVDNGFAGHGSSAISCGLHFGERGGYTYFGLYGNDLGGTIPVRAGVWYNIAISYDYSTKIKTIYVNGVYDAQGGTVGYSGTGSNFQLGRYPWSAGSSLLGSMPIFKFYTRALSSSEISLNFNALRGRFGV